MPNTVQNQNSGDLQRFPFHEANADSPLPDEFLVDAQVLLPSTLFAPVWIQSLTVSGASVSGVVMAGQNRLGVFKATQQDLAGGVSRIVTKGGIDRGLVVFGRGALSVFGHLGLGTTSFDQGQTALEPGCIIPIPPVVLEEILTSAGSMNGKIALVEGNGIRIVKTSDSSIRFDAVGSTTSRQRCCPPIGPSLLGINDVVPDQFGGLRLLLEPFAEAETPEDVRQILRIQPGEHEIVFSLSK